MQLADSNFWLALALSGHSLHKSAATWLADQSPKDPVAFCRSTQQSFLRLLSTSAVLSPYGIPPLTNADAWRAYEGLLADRRIAFAHEPPGLELRWKALAARTSSSPKLWMDAYLAAFAIAGGHKLITTDMAFKQFKGLDVVIL